jgi:hypothetical protein
MIRGGALAVIGLARWKGARSRWARDGGSARRWTAGLPACAEARRRTLME